MTENERAESSDEWPSLPGGVTGASPVDSPSPRDRVFAPASRGQLMGIVTIVIVSAITGVVMLIIAYVSGHLSLTIWAAFIACEFLAAATGIIALALYLKRRNIIIRAVRLTFIVDAEPHIPKEDEDYLEQEGAGLRDALVSSGDLDIAYRIQDALTKLEAK